MDAKRKEELERKRKKLEELKRARQQLRADVNSGNVGGGGNSGTSGNHVTGGKGNAGSALDSVDALVNSLVGDAKAEAKVEAKAEAKVEAKVEASNTDAKASATDEVAAAMLHERLPVPRLSMGDCCVVVEFRPRERVVYSKDVQTAVSSFVGDDEEDREKVEKVEKVDKIENVDKVEEQAPTVTSTATATATAPTSTEPKQLSEAERQAIADSDGFAEFVGRGGRLVERALYGGGYDYLRDYGDEHGDGPPDP